jgi:hypothetical protein
MSLYDDASFIFTAAGAAGNRDTAHSIKPAEKLKYTHELVSNGRFNDTSSWTVTNNASISGGKVTFTQIVDDGVTNTSSACLQGSVFTNVGKTYKISFTLTHRSGVLRVGTSHDSDIISGTHTSSSGVGTKLNKSGRYSFYYTATSSNSGYDVLRFQRNNGTGPYDFDIDNVSVREVEQRATDFNVERGADESATRVGPDGFIEKHTHNLLKSTEDFNNSTYWSLPNSYVSPAPEGEVVGYNGSKEGVFTLHKTLENTNHYFMAHHVDNVVTTAATEVWTYSVYAKGDGNSRLLMGIWSQYDENANPQQIAYAQKTFTLSGDSEAGDAAGGDTSNTRSHPRFYKEKIGDDGWYRLSLTNVSAIAGDRVRLQPGGMTDIMNTTGKVYVMHPQFEKGSGATQYVRSYAETCKGGVLEDEPRFDYSGGGCPGLLLEREVTNLIPQTEWIKAWTNTGVTNSSFILTPNFAISPDGSYNATYYNASSHAVATLTDGWRRHIHHLTLETSTKYVFSFYCKNINATRLKTRVYDNTNAADIVAEQDYLSKVNTTDWTRIEVVFTTASDSTSYAVFLQSGMTIQNNDPGTWNGGAGGGVLWWGAQVEKQNHTGGDYGYASSYIPNYAGTGTVTRKKDDVPDQSYRFGRDTAVSSSGLGVTGNTTMFDGKQATIFIEANNLRQVGNTRWWHIFDEDKNEDPRILLYAVNAITLSGGGRGWRPKLQLRADHDSPGETVLTGPDLNYGDTFKAIARLNNNIVTLFVNGVQYDAGTTRSVSYDFAQWESSTVGSYERFDLAHEAGDLGHKIYNLVVFPTVLTDEECKNLTSLT